MQVIVLVAVLIVLSLQWSNVRVLARDGPIVVNSSLSWDGNDGPWSSFVVQIGTPPQSMKVFVSTSAYQTSVIVPQGCKSTDSQDCVALRGGIGGHLFDYNLSSSWVNNTANLTWGNIYPLGVGTALGYFELAELGFDNVALGLDYPTLENQTVAGVMAKDTYLGFFGIAPRASNFSGMENPIPSYMENLRNKSMIPSLSWAYTAGNQYRKQEGSLILGGYDASKIADNLANWPMSEDFKDLTVQIYSIAMFDGSVRSSLLPESIPAFMDSSFPYIWLPSQACVLFEEAFGLTWDNATELYLVNDSLHDTLVLQNATVVFTIGDPNDAYVNITFPYAAFDLTASPPLVTTTSRYFPFKRAANSIQFTLGRTFFQEAYVVADYERGNFSVFQCNWVKSDAMVVAIKSLWASPEKPRVIKIAVAGTIGGIAGIMMFAGLLYWNCVRKSRRPSGKEPTTLTSEDDDKWYKSELHGDDMQPNQELESERNRWVEEAEANEARIFELLATEEVAAELRSPHEGSELAAPCPNTKLPAPQTATLAEGEENLPRPRMLSEVSSQIRDSIAGDSAPVSPPLPDQLYGEVESFCRHNPN